MIAEPAHPLPSLAPPPSTGCLPATPAAELDAAVASLKARKDLWRQVPATERIRILDELVESFSRVTERWVEACLEAEGIPPANPASGEEWLAGPYLVFRNLRLLRESLRDIAAGRRPAIPGPLETRPDGRVTARVFPHGIYDRILYPGVWGEVWMPPGSTPEQVVAAQAQAYFGGEKQGKVCLVLGAGNVSSIGPMDALYKLFVDDEVVLFKVHPVNDYLGPLLEEGFAPLLRRGFFGVVYGGAEEGAHLTGHPDVDSIHITGSDKTVEAIVFGPGREGAERKAQRRPLLDKPISSELGNVSAVIVVPGPWRRSDHHYQAENLVSMLTNNAGFNCNAARVVVTRRGWEGRGDFLAALRRELDRTPTRRAYYPGAEERWERFLAAHPEAERFGAKRFGELPWTFIPGLDPKRTDDLCFTTEAFASVFGEVPLEATSVPDFLARATTFANDVLWGTLNVTLIVHPETLRDEAARVALDRAVAELRFGTVTVNHWAAVGYGLVVTTWGAWPGSDFYDIQSGSGVVHNTLMFDRPEKSVIHAPFKAWPKPPWFASHQTAHELGRLLVEFEKEPSMWKLPAIFQKAMRG